MNVHLLVTFSKNPDNSPFVQALKKQDINFTIFSDQISLNYSRRIWLYFVGWPKMILFAVHQAARSLYSSPSADWVVVQSHFDVLAFGCLAKILFRKKPKLMLLGFIYTKRNSFVLSQLKYIYFSIILRMTECIICHSTTETENNTLLFNLPKSKFIYMPFGLHLELPEQMPTGITEPYAFSAGRSGRDYDLLVSVFSEIGYPLHIICDSYKQLPNRPLPENIKIFRDCYGDSYVTELAKAKIVVIPLAVDDISAGQMVLLQAMVLNKPMVITDTPTTRLYAENDQTALMIKMGDFNDMKTAVKKLWIDESLASNLASNALAKFNAEYSMAAYIRNICDILKTY